MTVSAQTHDTPESVHASLKAPQSTTRQLTLAYARRRNPQQTVPSPCVGVCKMDAAKGWCAGCFRTLEELTVWSRATDATKLAVWAQIELRQA